MFILALGLDLTAVPATTGKELGVSVKSIAQITIDDDGRALHYPSTLFFDPIEQEIYLVNGGTSKVVVYGADYFPLVSIGVGRGIDAPRGIFVTENGTVYICQTRSRTNPSNRVTILNAAFFPIREIILDKIPELADFRPSQLVVSREGLIYLSGTSSRGVMVLDNDGSFLRRLEPMDVIHDQEAVAAAAWKREEEEKNSQTGEDSTTETEQTPNVDIPEEFRPKRNRDSDEQGGPGLGPVRVRKVVTDSEGHLYLISAETSKIYVYNADESLLFSFGIKGGTAGKLSQPYSLAVDEKRKLLYVADYMRHSVLVYDFNGSFLFEFGGQGGAPGWFNFPVDIALNRHGQVVVADLFNKRVQVLEASYEVASYLGRKKATTDPEAETVEKQDNVPAEEAQASPSATDPAKPASPPPSQAIDGQEKLPFVERGLSTSSAADEEQAAPPAEETVPAEPAPQ